MAVLLWYGICKFFGKIVSCFKKALSVYSPIQNFILRILGIHQASVSSVVVSSPQQPHHHQQRQVSISIQDGHIIITTGSQHVNVRTIISLSTINSWILSSPSSAENICQQLVINGWARYLNPAPVSSQVIAAHAIPEVDSGLASSSSSSSSSSSLLLPSSSSSSFQGLQFGVIVVDKFDLGRLEAATTQDQDVIIKKGLQFGSITVEEFEEFRNSSLEKRKRKARRGHRGGRQYQARKRREQWWKFDTTNDARRCTTDNIIMVLLIIIYFLFLCFKLFDDITVE